MEEEEEEEEEEEGDMDIVPASLPSGPCAQVNPLSLSLSSCSICIFARRLACLEDLEHKLGEGKQFFFFIYLAQEISSTQTATVVRKSASACRVPPTPFVCC